jgi:hypothetical protein
MKTTISAKLKLQTTPEQFKALRETQLAYRDSLNFASRYAFEHGKISNKEHVPSILANASKRKLIITRD